MLLFKVIHEFVDTDRSAMFDIQFDRSTRGHDLHIRIQIILTLMLANFIFVIVNTVNTVLSITTIMLGF